MFAKHSQIYFRLVQNSACESVVEMLILTPTTGTLPWCYHLCVSLNIFKSAISRFKYWKQLVSDNKLIGVELHLILSHQLATLSSAANANSAYNMQKLQAYSDHPQDLAIITRNYRFLYFLLPNSCMQQQTTRTCFGLLPYSSNSQRNKSRTGQL